ncbi:hypothetical protein A2Y85_01650 [candidate division WOR-3 bacterium RBG_13_43_14]|uniref:Uncharacterized protein n=1 Tax=candidate division WOR-3 bacterium RBG_13_43_14 TaxID=1802590 RepID=A0A1F4U222_UNCW3|nr:MAG: hypothetical protein A2Y85_01650 [candidate division WOR-3 bacterium RBG_13_43_14]
MLTNLPGAESNRIVVRFKNGNILKGLTRDFVPEKPKFHLTHPDERIEEIDTETLKAVFFVKSYDGDKGHQDAKGFSYVDPVTFRGMKIKVTFQDNETIYGSTMGYNKNRKGFFILPADPESNNIRIYVVASAIKEVKLGSQAET